ncbi:MAG: electron transport complex subunit RsxB [Rhodoferax sp.]
MDALAARIDAVLPQTQCTRCGYPDCAGYAQAVASGAAAINQCPPGGAEGIARLARVTSLPVLTLNPVNGFEGPRGVAVIDEDWCIGCTLCIAACPTDAIIGSNKLMHTVIEPYCTGCELCIPACPVDCISMETVTHECTGWAAWSQAQADEARVRYGFHSYKRTKDKDESDKRLEETARAKLADRPAQSQITDPDELAKKRTVIEAALARARARRSSDTQGS